MSPLLPSAALPFGISGFGEARKKYKEKILAICKSYM
jgi:hypothetical protein